MGTGLTICYMNIFNEVTRALSKSQMSIEILQVPISRWNFFVLDQVKYSGLVLRLV